MNKNDRDDRNDYGYPLFNEEDEYLREKEARRDRDFLVTAALFIGVNLAFWVPVLVGLVSCITNK
jgi:hypothetical protein